MAQSQHNFIIQETLQYVLPPPIKPKEKDTTPEEQWDMEVSFLRHFYNVAMAEDLTQILSTIALLLNYKEGEVLDNTSQVQSCAMQYKGSYIPYDLTVLVLGLIF